MLMFELGSNYVGKRSPKLMDGPLFSWRERGGGGGGQDEKFSSANSFVLIYPPLYFKSTFTKTFFLTMSGDLLKRGNINFFFRQKEKRKRNRAVDD